jgi:hypothetical protein
VGRPGRAYLPPVVVLVGGVVVLVGGVCDGVVAGVGDVTVGGV